MHNQVCSSARAPVTPTRPDCLLHIHQHQLLGRIKMAASNGHIYDVIVIGAGVEGSATAYYLTSRHTKNVLLLEQVSCQQFHYVL